MIDPWGPVPPLGALLLLGYPRPAAYRHGELGVRVLALELQLGLLAGLQHCDHVEHGAPVAHRAAVDPDEHVTGLYASLVGRSAAHDLRDERPPGSLDLQGVGQLAGNVASSHPYPAAGD